MAASLPVITTDRGSIKEMITPGENGFITCFSPPGEIDEKASLLIEDKNLRKRIEEKNYRRVREKFALDQYLDGVVWVIEKFIS